MLDKSSYHIIRTVTPPSMLASMCLTIQGLHAFQEQIMLLDDY